MANCPICLTKLTENAKFCAECGAPVNGAASERAWITAMQERIKSVRSNNMTYSIVAGLGLLIAVAVPFVMRYVLLYNMDLLSWSLTAVGAVLFIGALVANGIDDRRVRKLIVLLQKGKPPTVESEPETESADTD